MDKEQEKLILQHIEHADYIAKYRWSKCKDKYSLDEIKSCAYTGLVIAATKYDSNKNTTFKTFCTKYITGQILNMVRRDKRYNYKEGVPYEQPIVSLNNLANESKEEFIYLLEEWKDSIDILVKECEVEELLSLLNEDEKELINLYYVQGLTQDEIGSMLKIHRSTVSKKIKIIIEKIKGCLTTGK